MTNARQARTAREKAAEMRAAAARKQARQRAAAIAGAVLAALVIVVASGILILTAKQDKANKERAAVAPPANIVDGGLQIGSSSAKVTLDVWEDFQCPACQVFKDRFKTEIEGWVADGTVRVIYHPVSILNRYSSTEYSTRSLNAFAAVINADPTAAEKYHDLLFKNQPPENTAGLPDAKLLDLAEQAGVQRSAVEAAITGVKYRGWTETVTDDFSKRGYTGTPTIVVNGKQVEKWEDLVSTVQQAAG